MLDFIEAERELDNLRKTTEGEADYEVETSQDEAEDGEAHGKLVLEEQAHALLDVAEKRSEDSA